MNRNYQLFCHQSHLQSAEEKKKIIFEFSFFFLLISWKNSLFCSFQPTPTTRQWPLPRRARALLQHRPPSTDRSRPRHHRQYAHASSSNARAHSQSHRTHAHRRRAPHSTKRHRSMQKRRRSSLSHCSNATMVSFHSTSLIRDDCQVNLQKHTRETQRFNVSRSKFLKWKENRQMHRSVHRRYNRHRMGMV
jgi:hypothetical protein